MYKKDNQQSMSNKLVQKYSDLSSKRLNTSKKHQTSSKKDNKIV